MNLFPTVPDEFDGPWTDGNVYVHLKDSIFERSSPSRHATELLYDLRDMTLMPTRDGDHFTPKFAVIMKYHDGGSDHNVSHASVQLACIAEFLITGVDMLVSLRCVPQQSWTNPAERIMSDVNFALQGLSFTRRDASPYARARQCDLHVSLTFMQQPRRDGATLARGERARGSAT